MPAPTDRRYIQTHEWHKPDAGQIVIGLSKFAVDELTDITYIDLVKTEGPIKAGEVFGEIESVKATSEMYCGVDGVISSINTEVIENPAIINQDPYERGWLIKVRPSDPAQLEMLMSAADYDREIAASR